MSPDTSPAHGPRSDAALIAVATGDPFDIGTFSGYSARLFGAIADRGVEVTPMSTRTLHWSDALTGAIRPSGFLPRRRRPGRGPIRPNWYWSRRSFERFCGRFDDRLARLGRSGVLLQVGTHVRTTLPGYLSFCVTDATVVQAARSGQFTIGQVSPRVIAEAIDCQREVLSSCEKVFVLSQWAAASVIGDYGYPEDRVVVVGAGANLAERRPRRLVTDQPYALFVGRDWERKGGPLLLEAFGRVRAAHPTARLKIVGCRPDIHQAGVDVVGPIDTRTDAGLGRLLDLYAGATCFCLVSVLDPFPNVILEAGSMGVPAVSTDEGSRPEMIVNGTTGILVRDRDPASVAAAILSLFEDPERAEAMGEAAKRLVEARYTWPVVARRVLDEMGMGAQRA